MYAAVLSADADEAEFRGARARRPRAPGRAAQVVFVGPAEPTLCRRCPRTRRLRLSVPRGSTELLRDAICHRARGPLRPLLRGAVAHPPWRARARRRPADPTVARLAGYARNVRRDIHKMHAFLRFRERSAGGATFYTSPGSSRSTTCSAARCRFSSTASPAWTGSSPHRSAPPVARRRADLRPAGAKPASDEDRVLDEVWLTYYRTTFNPARVRVKAMTAEMPRQYWRNMPETALSPG